jgi:prepilin-type N-terminal cleavage/methylation domain-containing protein
MNTRITVRSRRQRGFSLIEALVALVVMAFGMLALAGMQLTLSRSGDIAKQRVEAMRLAQARIERMRAFTGISSGAVNWNGLDAIANETVTTNATYTVASTMAGLDTDAMRPVNVTVSWTDRANEQQTVAMATILSQSDPRDVGYLGTPLPANRPLRRPKNRDINIPYPAVDLANGTSAYQVNPTYVIVFSNLNANVVQLCDPNQANATAAQILASTCTTVSGYIVAGYLSVPSGSWTALGMNHSGISRNTAGSEAIRCGFGDAVDQNSTVGATIAGYKYYICVVPVNTPFLWGGRMRVGAVPTNSNYIVCRYEYLQTNIDANERNIQPYASVDKSLDEQNYLLTTTSNNTNGSIAGSTSACPSSMAVAGVSRGVVHQDCRGSRNSNASTECPAVSP